MEFFGLMRKLMFVWRECKWKPERKMDLNNGEKWMKNEYYIEIECRMVNLMSVFEKLCKIGKVV